MKMVGELPWMYENKEEFFALPPAERAPYIWEALVYFVWAGAQPEADQSQVSKQTTVVCGIAQDVAKELAIKLGEEGAWRNAYDPRWPRYHPGSKNPLYLTGCYPPLLLCLQFEDKEAWEAVEFDESQKEMTAWLRTPAGMFGIADEERRSLEDASAQYEQSADADRKAQADLKVLRARLERARAELRLLDAKLGFAPPNLKPPRKLD